MIDPDLIDWLLKAESPSIRYFTYRDLLDRAPADPALQAAQRELMCSGPVPAILTGQSPAGHWAGEQSYYTPKYTSTHWSMMLLIELGVDCGDPRFQRGIDFMLADTQKRLQAHLEEQSYGLLCFWGNMLRYAVYGGRLNEAETIINGIAKEVRLRGWGCPHNAELSCAWGVARALWGLAEIPAVLRSPRVQSLIEQGLDYLLGSYALAEADYPTPGTAHKLWHKLNFPLFYQTDILFVLHVVAELDALDHPGAQPALDWLRSKRQANGHWRGVSPYSSRTWANLGDSDRWVSLYAARVLKGSPRITTQCA